MLRTRLSTLSVLVLALAVPAHCFSGFAGLWKTHTPSPRIRAAAGPRMGLFDQIGKALAESMANDDNLGKVQNPGFREGYDGPSKVTVRFTNSGTVVESYGGERLGDVCRKAGESIQYGCQKGTCGTCEVSLSTPSGTNQVRCCEAIIPKHELDAIPEYCIVVPDPNVALKRKLDWEQVKNRA